MVSFTCLRSRYYDILILQLFTFNFFNSHVLPDDGRTASRNVQPNILYIHICVCVCVRVWVDGWMDGWMESRVLFLAFIIGLVFTTTKRG